MQWPETAEALMRSRFEAFRSGDVEWLLATWHPSTRPVELTLDDNPNWRGLRILATADGGPGDQEGMVEFRASYIAGGELGILHERSRFQRVEGRWMYVDGVIIDG